VYSYFVFNFLKNKFLLFVLIYKVLSHFSNDSSNGIFPLYNGIFGVHIAIFRGRIMMQIHHLGNIFEKAQFEYLC